MICLLTFPLAHSRDSFHSSTEFLTCTEDLMGSATWRRAEMTLNTVDLCHSGWSLGPHQESPKATFLYVVLQQMVFGGY